MCVYIHVCLSMPRDKQTDRHMKRAKVSKELKKSCWKYERQIKTTLSFISVLGLAVLTSYLCLSLWIICCWCVVTLSSKAAVYKT